MMINPSKSYFKTGVNSNGKWSRKKKKSMCKFSVI